MKLRKYKNIYNLIQTSITNHAKRVNLKPCEVQSILWLTYKNYKDGR